MTTRQRILLALAQWPGPTPPTLRDLARITGIPFGTVKQYFSPSNGWRDTGLNNSRIISRIPGKARTLRLGPQAAVLRDRCGKAKAVYQIVPVCEFEAQLCELERRRNGKH